jgi:ligand-binding sensor domain-containing protein
VATSNGVAIYEGGQWRKPRRTEDLSWYAIGQLAPDPDGKLWALPEYGGAPSVVDPTTLKVSLPPGWPENSPDVISVAFAGDATWVGTTGGLLRIKDGAVRLFTQADGLPDDQAGALLATPTALWIGTHAGLAQLDLESDRIVTDTVASTAGHTVDRLALAPDGAVWVGSYWGEDGINSAVERFAGADHQIWANGQAPLDGDRVRVHVLTIDDTGNVWMTSSRGVARWDGQNWVTWNSAQGAPASDVYALLPLDGAMWMAGHSGMIDRLDRDGGWQHFRPKGLTGDVLDMHITSDGALWLATEDGLLHYGP